MDSLTKILLISFSSGIISLIVAYFLNRNIKKIKVNDKKVLEIGLAIREGAMAFLFGEYKFLSMFVLIIALTLGFTLNNPDTIINEGLLTAIAFVIGAFCSSLAGFIGMRSATNANFRTTIVAKKSFIKALRVAFNSGAVMGLTVVGLGLFGLSSVMYAYSYLGISIASIISIIAGFSFGASSVALFARVGGGIYTKAADVGADLVGKVEAGIPEDDPRNPAVIADNVGDNVGDVAGMGADLFESYIGSIVAAVTLGFIGFGLKGLALPILLSAIGIISSIIGNFFVKAKNEKKIHAAFKRGTWISALLVIIGSLYLSKNLFSTEWLGPFMSIIFGLVTGVIIGLITEYYTSYDYNPVKKLAKSTTTGSATNIIQGLALGYESTALPLIVISIAIGGSYYFGGLYGIALAGVGMLSTLGATLAVDAYGPVADNAGGIAEMAGLPASVRKKTDALDSAGNTTAAIGKGFAIGSAALTSLALFSAYTQTVGLKVIDLTNPSVIIGVFLGAILVYLFASMTMKSVGKTAMSIVEEVRRQFKDVKGLMQGKAKADYKTCIDIATKGSLKQMILPGLMAIISPIIVGLISVEALGGLLVGALATGIMLAISMANSGGAWDNAKKYIETGKLGGKGSAAHKAAIVGDTIGDPFKDTSGPSLNILIKLMTIIALVFVPLFL